MPLHQVTLTKKLSLHTTMFAFYLCQKLLFLLLFRSNLAFVASICLAYPPSPSPPVFSYMYSDHGRSYSCICRPFLFSLLMRTSLPVQSFPTGFWCWPASYILRGALPPFSFMCGQYASLWSQRSLCWSARDAIKLAVTGRPHYNFATSPISS